MPIQFGQAQPACRFGAWSRQAEARADQAAAILQQYGYEVTAEHLAMLDGLAADSLVLQQHTASGRGLTPEQAQALFCPSDEQRQPGALARLFRK